VLASYVRYYHRSRLHLSLDKDAPDQRPVQSVGKIVATSEVGGLHHRYERRAANRTSALEAAYRATSYWFASPGTHR
jgi:hypothetical protein